MKADPDYINNTTEHYIKFVHQNELETALPVSLITAWVWPYTNLNSSTGIQFRKALLLPGEHLSIGFKVQWNRSSFKWVTSGGGGGDWFCACVAIAHTARRCTPPARATPASLINTNRNTFPAVNWLTGSVYSQRHLYDISHLTFLNLSGVILCFWFASYKHYNVLKTKLIWISSSF